MSRESRPCPLSLLLSLVLLSCNDTSGPLVCPQVGCDSGLDIELMGELPETFMIVLEVPSFRPLIVECSPSRPCGERVHVPDFTPDRVFVEVRGEGVQFQEEFIPEYETLRPNGPDCLPECRKGLIVVDVR